MIGVNKTIDNTGLLLAYDFNNPKSLVGPPMYNSANALAQQVGSGTSYSITAGSSSVYIPSLGSSTCQYVDFQNNYPTSGQCCWSPFKYTSGRIGVTTSTLYTYSIVYKCDSGYTHPNFLYRYEFTSGGVYISEAATHSTTNRVHLGGGWYWAWSTFTTSSTTAQMELYSFYYQYSTGADRFFVAKVLLTAGNYTGVHPRSWPDLNTGITTPIKDLTGTTTATPVGVTYTSAAQPVFGANATAASFNLGKSSYDLGIRRSATYTGWVKGTATTSGAYLISDFYSVYGMTLRINGGFAGADFYMYPNNHRVTYTNTFNTNTWYHLTGVLDGPTMYLYVNGVQVGSQTLGEDIGPSGAPLHIGSRGDIELAPTTEYLIGSIGSVKVLARAMTAAEILSMFTAERGAYGV